MRITHFPGMLPVDGLLWQRRPLNAWSAGPSRAWLKSRPIPVEVLQRTYRIVRKEYDRDLLWVAPRWIAWLYRWLPYRISWHRRPQEGAYPLWAVTAPKWRVAWLPAARDPRYGAHWGVLCIGRWRIKL
jgi:hypothetical protein